MTAAPALPVPLTGPAFGSYRPDEVSWLLTDLSAVDLEADAALREAAIQAGRAHYAESSAGPRWCSRRWPGPARPSAS